MKKIQFEFIYFQMNFFEIFDETSMLQQDNDLRNKNMLLTSLRLSSLIIIYFLLILRNHKYIGANERDKRHAAIIPSLLAVT